MGRARGPVISYSRTALILSFIIGTAIGLGIGWALLPVQFTNADPADLRSSYKDDYIRMIGAAFQLDGNVTRASQRLARLGLGNVPQSLNDFVTRESKDSKNAKSAATVADLARALGYVNTRPTAASTAASDRIGLLTPAPSAAETLAAYRLVEHTPLNCDDEPDQAHIRIFIRDSDGKDLPNVGIQVDSNKGEDVIYTGLKPERGIGYADVIVSPDTYTASIVGSRGEAASQLTIADPANCKIDRATTRGWKLVFQKQ